MKRLICWILVCLLCGCLAACGQPDTPIDDTPTSAPRPVSDTLDLTGFSDTLVYSEVYNMTVTPGDYLGKRVKLSGTFSVYTDEATGKNYYACVVGDATACCNAALEFVLRDDAEKVYPADYPAIGGKVTVEGVFGTYKEGENTYCQLSDATMSF